MRRDARWHRMLTPQEKEHIRQRYLEGVDETTIARELDVNGQKVSGVLRSARNSGRLQVGRVAQPVTHVALSGDLEAIQDPRYSPMRSVEAISETLWILVVRVRPLDGPIASLMGKLDPHQVEQSYGTGLYEIVTWEQGKLPDLRTQDVPGYEEDRHLPSDWVSWPPKAASSAGPHSTYAVTLSPTIKTLFDQVSALLQETVSKERYENVNPAAVMTWRLAQFMTYLAPYVENEARNSEGG